MLWITHSLALMDYFSWVFSRFTLDCFLSTSFSLPCLWLDNFSAPSRPLYLPSLSAALQRLPCRSLTQLDQQMHLGILLILSPVFDNYRVWLDWATVLAMKVLVIFKLSFNQHMDFMGTEHVEHKTDHHLQRKMVRFWKCSAVTLHENQTFYVGDTEPDSDHVYYQWNKMKNLPGWYIKKIWHSYDGWLWWPRRKSSICWFSNLHANWTKEFWWKRLLAPRVAWIPKGKHWLQI